MQRGQGFVEVALMVKKLMAFLVIICFGAVVCMGRPISREEATRRAAALDQVEKLVAAEKPDSARFGLIKSAFADEHEVEGRRRLLKIARGYPGTELDSFLGKVLKSEEDAGIRCEAAVALGKLGLEEALPTLMKVASTDPTTSMQIGDSVVSMSARRAAIFAIADWTQRFSKRADDAAKALRDLRVVPRNPDPESLLDARVQALYQVTREKSLLAPFFVKLKNPDAKVREEGVVAFRFFKLTKAPPEIVAELKDSSEDIRSWAALVLGEIGDGTTAEALMAVARDAKESAGPRCNAIGALGRMKVVAAAPLMEKLLSDAEPAVPGNAAIALYRISGKKVKEFPEGYDAGE